VIGILELTLIPKILRLIKFEVFFATRWKKLYKNLSDVQFNSQDFFWVYFAKKEYMKCIMFGKSGTKV
jgi:hypothetical protein